MSVCMYMHLVCAWYPQRLDSVRCPGTGVSGVCKQSYRFWEPNPASLQEQKVF